MKSAADNLKNELGLDLDKPIPASFNVPYYVHQVCLCYYYLWLSYLRIK